MGATVVLGEDFDILVIVASFPLVLDSEIGKLHRPVEVRQIVFMSPGLDVARAAIGSPVAVGSTTVVLLQKPLILALEVDLEGDAMDRRASVAKSLLRAQVRAVEMRIAPAFARAAGC